MEVLLAKKRLTQRLGSSTNANLPIFVSSRVIVKEGREFETFRTGDEGVVLCIHEEAGRCEVAFDGRSADPIPVALRHLCAVAPSARRGAAASSPRRAALPLSPRLAAAADSGARSSSVGRAVGVAYRSAATAETAGAKRTTVSRWKTVEQKPSSSGTSPQRSRASPPTSPERQAAYTSSRGGSKPLSPSVDALSETRLFLDTLLDTVTEPADCDAMMRRALRETSSAIEASLRVVQAMNIEKADVLGRRARVIMLSEETFSEWQQAVKALQSAGAHCFRALQSPPAKTFQGSSIAVPVECLGFPGSPQRIDFPGMPPLSAATGSSAAPPFVFRAPASFEGFGSAVHRSTSAPPCVEPLLELNQLRLNQQQLRLDAAQSSMSNASALMSPRSPLDSTLFSGGGAATLLSPRLIQGSLPAAQQVAASCAFVPSLPSLYEVAADPPLDTELLVSPRLSSPRLQAPPPAPVPLSLTIPSGAITASGLVPLPSVVPLPSTVQPLHPDAGRIAAAHAIANIERVKNEQHGFPEQMTGQFGVHDHLSQTSLIPPAIPDQTNEQTSPSKQTWMQSLAGATKPRSLTTPGGRALRPKAETRPGVVSNLSHWLNEEMTFLHRGLLGGSHDDDEQ